MQPCEQKDNVIEIKESVKKIKQTLFEGNGKPSILAQLEVGNEKFNEIDKKLDEIRSYGKAVVMAVLGLIGSTVWDIVQKHNADTYYPTHNKQVEVSK